MFDWFGESDPDYDVPAISYRFIMAYSWEQSAAVMDMFPEMLDDELVFELFKFQIDKKLSERDEETARFLQDNFDFFIQCQTKGVEAALDEQIKSFGYVKLLQEPFAENVRERMRQLPEIVAELKANPIHEDPADDDVLRSHPELVSPMFDELLAYAIRHNKEVDDYAYALLDLRCAMAYRRLDLAIHLGDLRCEANDWERASRAYQVASDALDLLFWLKPFRVEQQELALVDASANVTAAAAVTFAKRGMYGAVSCLERGRARTFRNSETRTKIIEEWFGTEEAKHEEAPAHIRLLLDFNELEKKLYAETTADRMSGDDMKMLARYLQELSPEESATLAIRIRQLESQVTEDPSLAIQFAHVWPLVQQGQSPESSPYYNELEYKRLLELFESLRDSHKKAVAGPTPTLESYRQKWQEVVATCIINDVQPPHLAVEDISQLVDDGLRAHSSVVWLYASKWGSFATILARREEQERISVHHIEVPITDSELREMLVGSTSSAGWMAALRGRGHDFGAWVSTLESVLGRLWTNCMALLEHELLSLGSRYGYLIPVGHFNWFPLHSCRDVSKSGAAEHEDCIAWSRLPALSILPKCRELAETVRVGSFTGVTNPEPSSRPLLESAELEIELVSSRFCHPRGDAFIAPRILKGKDASVGLVRKLGVEGGYSEILHFACHAVARSADGDAGGIILSGDRILKADRLRRAFTNGGRMVVLSCCSTGVPDPLTPDEGVDLPGVFLRANYAGVLATYWPVNDIGTTMLILRFYDEWLTNQRCPADSLLSAQQWMRDTTNAEKATYIREFKFSNLEELPETMRADLQRARSRLAGEISRQPANENSYEHPHFWAGFGLWGM